ncbi:hypothetical protein [Treponema succinifaciens]|nr:hypothetical protein [Treponema succinifaciens]
MNFGILFSELFPFASNLLIIRPLFLWLPPRVSFCWSSRKKD